MDTTTTQPTTTDQAPVGRHNPMTDWLERWEPLRWILDQREAATSRVEEFVEDGHLVIRAELPGIDPEKDVEIEVTDGLLHIGAEREERSEEERGEGYRTEFRYGRFERTIKLPKGTAADEITATYTDGILEVRIPVAEEVDKTVARISVQKG